MSTSVDLAALAARDECNPFSLLAQVSAGALFSNAVTGTGTTGITFSWNVVTVSLAANVYTVTFQPFDFTGTTFPYVPIGIVVGKDSTRTPAGVFVASQVVDQKSCKFHPKDVAGAPVALNADDRLAVLILGRRSRKTTNGSTVIDPLESLKLSSFNLGVTGL
jgi:hypothetical protein